MHDVREFLRGVESLGELKTVRNAHWNMEVERGSYVKREGVASLIQILAEKEPKLDSVKLDSIIEDRFVRELETSGFIKNLYDKSK